jgi:hypothetical protein
MSPSQSVEPKTLQDPPLQPPLQAPPDLPLFDFVEQEPPEQEPQPIEYL